MQTFLQLGSASPSAPASGETVTVPFTVTAIGRRPEGGKVSVSDASGVRCSVPASAGSCAFAFNGSGRVLSVAYTGTDAFAPSSGVTAIGSPSASAPPEVHADTFDVLEEHRLAVPAPGVLGNDADPSGARLSAALVSPTTHGALSLAASGDFTYTPNRNFSLLDDFTYRASNGATTASAGATVIVNAVNDPPVFTRGSDQHVSAGAGQQTVSRWATGIADLVTGEVFPDTRFAFLVEADRKEFFSVQPAIAPDGTLTYTPAVGARGTTTVTVRLRDNGGTANGGVDTSDPQSFTITIGS